MKVLLIEPRNCWIGLNIALGYLAASLKKNNIEVKVLDFANHRDYDVETLERYVIESYQPDLIGFSLFYIGYKQVESSIKRIKKYYSKAPIVVGGPQMLIERDQILRDIDELDFAIVGEGEDAIVELCQAVGGNKNLNEIDGLIYRDGNHIICNKERKPIEELDRLSFPDYRPFGVEKIKSYQIITSRGCPYQCKFCFRSSRYWRARSPENVIQELKYAIKEYDIKEFVVVDDSFNINASRVIKFCDILINENIKLPWRCSGARADRFTEEMVSYMKRAGCTSVAIGIESLQPEVFESLGKGEKLDKIIDSINLLKRSDLNVDGYFLIGIPGDTKRGTLDTYKKAKKLGLGNSSFAILLPFPGTKSYEEIYSRSETKPLADYHDVSTVWTFDPEYSQIKTAYETPEYPAKDKFYVYHRTTALEGYPRPPFFKNKFVLLIVLLYYIIKYGEFQFPAVFYKTMRHAVRRYHANIYKKTLYSTDIKYVDRLLPAKEILEVNE